MSEIQKCPNLVRGGGVNIFQKCPKFKNVPNRSEGGRGVSIFQKCLKFKNVPNVGGGGGVNPNWDIVPNFLVFFSDASHWQFLLRPCQAVSECTRYR